MWNTILYFIQRIFFNRDSLEPDEEIKNSHDSQSDGDTEDRSKVRTPSGTMSSSKQMNGEHLPVMSFQKKQQQTNVMKQAHWCSSWPTIVLTVNKSDDMTIVQKKLQDIDKLTSEREMLVIGLENFEHLDEKLETVNEDKALKTEIVKLNVKMAGLILQRHDEMKKTEQTIEHLNKTVENITSENLNLRVLMAELMHRQNGEMNKMAESRKCLKENVVRMSSEIATLRRKMEWLADYQQNDGEKGEAVRRLIETADRITYENDKLKQEIDRLRDCFRDDSITNIISGVEEEFLRATDCRKIKDKQDRAKLGDKKFQAAVKDDQKHRALIKHQLNKKPLQKGEEVKLIRPPVRLSGPHLPKLRDFKPLMRLGKGTFGKVVLVRKNGGVDNGALYAMKMINIIGNKSQENDREQCRTEHAVHERVANVPFLVGLYYAFQTNSNLCLALDYYPGGDLRTMLNWKKKLAESTARLYLAEIVLAVDHLHKIGVIHRDLKPENILIDSEGHIAVTDYGLCKEFPPDAKIYHVDDVCGTSDYMAPEMIQHKGYSMEVDWWSVGVIAYEMMAGFRPFVIARDESMTKLCRKIVHKLPAIPKNFTFIGSSFVRGLLEKMPLKRLTSGKTIKQDIMQHQFFNGINWDKVASKKLKMPYVPPYNSSKDVHPVQNLKIELLAHTTGCKRAEACLYVAPSLIPSNE
ncbi:probable serine/threonine-protein kinase ndrB [Zootermopsis nevadensis]|uniref:Ribosomal protein S6 kinase alpha-5 n=1 Tax=Zootermopsis nevadensis TaxID=136037 RepID=A0A067RLB1_ZOONE|nr:probable serine/threonine-protein kinase ndrB [Zootermopsis nevadensis]KDR20335.1 Ribosomal protein S6 kinase alpha-5 [Zootermopsis nevadensis]